MLLSSLFAPAPALPFTGLSFDTRTIKKGDVFFALNGSKVDGKAFTADAVTKGAVAIISETPLDAPIPVINTDNARLSLAKAAALFYPKQPETIVAVTGTSGKTSVAAFARQLFQGTGNKAASLGTIGVVKPNGETYGSLTTPDPVSLHKTLNELAQEGVSHLCFEASSHGLDQFRLDGVRIKAASFTNLSRDHLDYHVTVEAYLKAKLRLFNEILPQDGTAVIMQGEFSNEVIKACGSREIISIGGAGSTLGIRDIELLPTGQKLTLEVYGRRYFVEIPLFGRFQIENALVALGLGMATGLTCEEMLPVLSYIDGAKGRLEEVGRFRNVPIIVDYAHKPDALEKVLLALKPFAKRNLICVFGCGGDRDKGKRAIMGEIASRLADKVIITDDNPRSEEPATIRAEILAACPTAVEIGDRKQAIKAALEIAGEGDLIVIAGKGHEEGQIIKGVTHPFSDHKTAQDLIRELA